jgi:hypothetical protein
MVGTDAVWLAWLDSMLTAHLLRRLPDEPARGAADALLTPEAAARDRRAC